MATERWLVTGASGQLGGYVVQRLAESVGPGSVRALAGQSAVHDGGVASQPFDLSDKQALIQLLNELRPTHVIHLGAVTAVADVYDDPDNATRVNVRATQAIAQEVSSWQGRVVLASTDMVFDGVAAPYNEDSEVHPVSRYGRTKRAAEVGLLRFPNTVAIRIPLMYGLPLTLRETTFARQIGALRQQQPLRLFADEYRTPVWLDDAARALIRVARSEETGILHIAGPNRLSRLEMIQRAAEILGIESPHLDAISRKDIASPEPRPEDLSLDGSRFVRLFPDAAPGPMRPEVFEKGVYLP